MLPSNELPVRMMIWVTDVRWLGGHQLELTFSDGRRGAHDFSEVTRRSGAMVVALADPVCFARAFVEDGVLTWPNGYDWDPQTLYHQMSEAGELSVTVAAE